MSLQKSKILELETRKKIHEIITKHAGCHFREIERISKIPHTTLKYHLNYLSKYNLIKEKKDGNNIRYFSNEIEIKNQNLLSLLRQESVRKILLCLIENKSSSQSKIIAFVNLSPSTISWHMNNLVKKGVVKKSDKIYRLDLDEKEIIALLIQYKESFLDSLVNKTIDMWEVK